MLRTLAAGALLCAACIAAPAQADPGPSELAAARLADERGAEIYAFDQAAWHATDSFRADLEKQGQSIEKIAKDNGFGSSGFIVEPAAEGLLLTTFYGVKNGVPQALGRYWVRGSKVERGAPLKAGEDSALSPLAARLVQIRAKAFDQARADDAGICTDAFPNSVILPPRADGTIPAYIMSASTISQTFPAGGHHLYNFAADGTLKSKRAFSKSCVLMDWRNSSDPSAGIGVSALLDRQPNEIHVFIGLMAAPTQFFVIIEPGRELWAIDKGRSVFKKVLKPD